MRRIVKQVEVRRRYYARTEHREYSSGESLVSYASSPGTFQWNELCTDEPDPKSQRERPWIYHITQHLTDRLWGWKLRKIAIWPLPESDSSSKVSAKLILTLAQGSASHGRRIASAYWFSLRRLFRSCLRFAGWNSRHQDDLMSNLVLVKDSEMNWVILRQLLACRDMFSVTSQVQVSLRFVFFSLLGCQHTGRRMIKFLFPRVAECGSMWICGTLLYDKHKQMS